MCALYVPPLVGCINAPIAARMARNEFMTVKLGWVKVGFSQLQMGKRKVTKKFAAVKRMLNPNDSRL